MKLLVGAAAALHTACSADKPTGPKTNGPAAAGGDDGLADDGGSRPPESSGYLVVDMLPPPSRCGTEVAPNVVAKAVLRPSQLGNDIVLTLHHASGGKIRLGSATEIQVQNGGTGPAQVKEVGNDLEVSFLYDGTSREAYVNLPVVCDADVGSLSAVVEVDPNAQKPGATLNASVRPGYGY
ncbi:MAG: hypothetical protein U0414_06680 [Polyangiaceae bacterium]